MYSSFSEFIGWGNSYIELVFKFFCSSCCTYPCKRCHLLTIQIRIHTHGRHPQQSVRDHARSQTHIDPGSVCCSWPGPHAPEVECRGRQLLQNRTKHPGITKTRAIKDDRTPLTWLKMPLTQNTKIHSSMCTLYIKLNEIKKVLITWISTSLVALAVVIPTASGAMVYDKLASR